MTTTTHDRDLGAPDFLQLAGQIDRSAVFTCSTTVGGVTGSLCVTEGVLTLGGSQPTVQLSAADIRSWWDTPASGTFSLDVESRARHSVVLLSQFRGATVHAMTQAFGPRRRRSAVSA